MKDQLSAWASDLAEIQRDLLSGVHETRAEALLRLGRTSTAMRSVAAGLNRPDATSFKVPFHPSGTFPVETDSCSAGEEE